ncbi:unnamed protein product, partial [Rotaria socialis]
EFEDKKLEYFATTEAKLTSILSRFILDKQLKFTLPENYFSVFDSLGRSIPEDCQINTTYRSDEHSPVHIRILQCKQDANIGCELTIITSQDEPRNQNFNPITTWKEISLWSKIADIKTENPVDGLFFWNIEQKHIIDENETISLTLGKAESVIVDVLDGTSVIDIILSYDKNIQTIRILSSCPVHSILNNTKYLEQLGLKISLQEYTLVFVSNESEKKILEKTDMESPISDFALLTDKPVHFQISILIQIILYDNEQEIPIHISHRNITIKQLFDMIEMKNDYKYLASYQTKVIFSENTLLSVIKETKFVLAKERHTCLVSIKQAENALIEVNDESMQNQRYLIIDTIDNIYIQNKSIGQDQYLLYNRVIIPSRKMPLSLFLSSETSSIEFNLRYEKLTANVTIMSDEQKNPIEFQCEPTMTIGRVHVIVCQLWKLNKQLYNVTLLDESIIDQDEQLSEIGEGIEDLKLKLISTSTVKCAITYQNETITISATDDTPISSIMKEVLEKLLVSVDDIEMFEFQVLEEPDSSISVDLDSTVTELRTDLDIESDTLSFQLVKKGDEN